MLCKSPIIIRGLAVGCARCEFCKINKRREWTARFLLEDTCHSSGSMVTLTYDQSQLSWLEDFNPETGEFVPTLRRRDFDNFLKRLRINLQRKLDSRGDNLRFAGCGEYGDERGRPHYHLALWNFTEADRDLIERAWSVRVKGSRERQLIGSVDFQELNETTMHYIAGYVMKKMTSKDDARLSGREPEFRAGSRVPPLGYRPLQEWALKHPDWLIDDGDVVSEVRVGRGTYQIGRTLRAKIRQLVGVSLSGNSPPHKIDALYEEMRSMSECTELSEKDKSYLRSLRCDEDKYVAEELRLKVLTANRQKARNAEARHKLRLLKMQPRERDLDET